MTKGGLIRLGVGKFQSVYRMLCVSGQGNLSAHWSTFMKRLFIGEAYANSVAGAHFRRLYQARREHTDKATIERLRQTYRASQLEMDALSPREDAAIEAVLQFNYPRPL